MSAAELVAFVCCDLGSIVRGRSLPASELGERLTSGVGWVPANHSLTPLGALAEESPFGSTGDLRLLPDPGTHVHVRGDDARVLVLATYRDTDVDRSHPLADALTDLRREVDTTRMTVSGLDVDGIVAYVEATAGQQLETDAKHRRGSEQPQPFVPSEPGRVLLAECRAQD